jgi:hypothetical protein
MNSSASIQIVPSHVALLVPSVRKAANSLRRFEFQIGPEELFEAEGTKEIYVEYGASNSLLLLEAAGPGAYQRAMEKRGPGLHHLAIDVLNLDQFLASLPDGGWSLHEISAETMKKTRTAWLYYRGFPALIEVQERAKLNSAPLFVDKVILPVGGKFVSELVSAVGLAKLIELNAKELGFSLGGKHRVSMADLT